MSDDVAARLLAALEGVEGGGSFCAAGKIAIPPPTLEVEGVGRIPLPLRKTKADALRRRARQAPYGKGAETLVDLDVRRVWEVDAGLVALSGEGWDETLTEVVAEVAKELGLGDSEIHAHLYKLLLYEPGGFFLPHRDGEKLDGMVATLVVNLPSEHEGGELIVRHDGRRKMVRFGGPKSLELRYAAFYADCEHEVKPVTSGRRLVLAYNLTVAKSARDADGPGDDGPAAAVARVLAPWAREGDPDGRSPRLAVLLDHGYTQAGLALDALKGADRSRAGLLFEAARRSGCDAFLALVTLHESGMGEEDYGGGRRDRYQDWDDEDDEDDEGDEDDGGPYTMVEVYEETLTAGCFRDADGRAWDVGAVPLLEGEVASDEAMGDDPPDREEYEGYTGNEGMTLERWYHRAAVVLWPSASRLGVLLDAGVDAAVGGLAAMVDGWAGAKARSKEKAALGEECRIFARRLIAAWPSRHQSDAPPPWERPDPDRPALLGLLAAIGDLGLIAAWIRGPFAHDATLDPGPALGDLGDRLGWPTIADALEDAFADTSRETIERNARLLAEWSGRKGAKEGRRSTCGELAGPLLAFLEGWRDPEGARDWKARAVDRVQILTTLVRLLIELDDVEGLDRLIAAVLEPASGWDVVTVQVPALRELDPWLRGEARRPIPALVRWLSAVRDELRRRTVEAPVEPVDLRRDDSIGCRCADCADVASFLRDPATATFRLRAPEARRRHVEQQVRHRPIDLACHTERKGSPHTLVLTKTKATYERALAEHRADLKRLEEVGAMLAWCEGLG
ncbi:MAG: hypothetical protein BGO49_04650 [Planctomycetales bacterium 71-10]|nr:MAG: hypothetical protein BGO49_04650 [Planctomycetales bacterium 71-10]